MVSDTLSLKDENLQWLLDMLIPIMNGARNRRKYIENEWLECYKVWAGWPNPEYYIPLSDGGIHYFIPHARRSVERNVKRGTKLLMPNQDWHQTLPFSSEVSHENAEAVHNVIRYVYTKKLPTKRNISSLLRCLYLYNFFGLHTSAIIQNNEVWPYQEDFDPFNFYIFPDTASSTKQALLLFEDCIIPYQVYNSYVDKDNPSKSLYKYIKADNLYEPTWPWHLVERLAYKGLTNPSDFTQGSTATLQLTGKQIKESIHSTNNSLTLQAKSFVSLSKVYFRISSSWYYCVIATNIRGGRPSGGNCDIVRLDNTENEPLYRWGNTRPLPGELYTSSPMDDIRTLQNLCNNSLSQVESNRSAFAEPPIIVDSSIGRTQEKIFGNRRMWMVDGNPNELFKSLDINDTATEGIRAFQIYKGLLDQNSGGGLPEGQPGRNMPRAGFAANTLLNVSLIDVEDDADTCEQEVLTPSVGDVYHIILEYTPNSQIIKIPNKNPQLVKAYRKRDLKGDYSFTWLGSLGFQDTQVRADKFTQFMQTLFNPQVFQLLMQQLQSQKQTIDIAGILKTWYSYGLGERGLGDIIIPMDQQQIQAFNQPSPEIQAEQQKNQMELQQSQQEHQMDMQSKQMELALQLKKAELELRTIRSKNQLEQQKQHMDFQGKVLDMNLKRQQAVDQHHIQQVKHLQSLKETTDNEKMQSSKK